MTKSVQIGLPYPEEELLAIKGFTPRVVDAYNELGSPYKGARQMLKDALNEPAPSRRIGKYGMDYTPETTRAINAYQQKVTNLSRASEDAGRYVKERMLQTIEPVEGIGLDLSFDALNVVAVFVPKETERQYSLDLDRPDKYELLYLTEEPIFWKWGKQKVKHKLSIPR